MFGGIMAKTFVAKKNYFTMVCNAFNKFELR